MILYKKDSKGKIRQLDIRSEQGTLIQESGRVGGKLVTHSKVCKPKNVGKSNATTSETQANVEAVALVALKLREGYFTSKTAAKASDVILPMLAKDYFKELKKLVDKHIVIQPKLDGIRCMLKYEAETKTITALSRKGVVIENINHILKEFRELLTEKNLLDEDITLDGELYRHGRTFQEVTKLVKNKPNYKHDVIQYHVYDVIDRDATFLERYMQYNGLIPVNSPFIKKVLMYEVDGDLHKIFSIFIKKGYEGMMVRVADSLYKVGGRSSDLLKYKEFIDIALPIVKITPNDANPKHGTVWVDYKGTEVKTGAKLSHADREDLLTNRASYIGKTAEIRFFEYTDTGSLRFPVYHGIRIDK